MPHRLLLLAATFALLVPSTVTHAHGGPGKCAGVRCVASDACHRAGTCDPTTGACSNPVAADTTPCDDGNACTQRDVCRAGVCVGTPRRDGTGCDDHNACTVRDVCQAGMCHGVAVRAGTSCSDGNACTERDVCNGSGVCRGTPRRDGTSCDDWNPCTGADVCRAGVCRGTARHDGTRCETGIDSECASEHGTCEAGTCTPTTVRTCAAPDQCHVGLCQPETGGCFSREASAGTSCDDGDACTQTDTCHAGVCLGGAPLSCTPSDRCHVALCEPATGTCEETPTVCPANGSCDPATGQCEPFTWHDGDVVSYSQSDWGAPGTDAAELLIANYDTIYAATSGVIEVGIPGTSGFSITLTSTDSVLAYLAASGPVDALDGDYGDPTQTPSGDFGGEVVALRLNIDFSDSSVMVGTSGHLFGDLTVCGVIDAPSLNGSTVREVLGVAEEALGGGTTTDPITSLDPVVDEINVAFEAGTVTPFANDHLVPGACP